VENYLSQYEEELVCNGYDVIKGKRLKSFKSVLQEMDVPEIYFGNIAKSPQLARNRGQTTFFYRQFFCEMFRTSTKNVVCPLLLVAANRELIARFEKKIQATLSRVWGETP
jgi:hypothetical protein